MLSVPSLVRRSWASTPIRFRISTEASCARLSERAIRSLPGFLKVALSISVPASSRIRMVTRMLSFSGSMLPITSVPTWSARAMLSRATAPPRYCPTPPFDTTVRPWTDPSALISPSVRPSAT